MKEFEDIFYLFLWDKKPSKVAEQYAILPLRLGGLKILKNIMD